MFLPLLYEILESRIPHCCLCNWCDTNARKTEVGHAECIRKAIGQSDQSKRIHDVETFQGAMPRIVAECESVTRLTYQMWSDCIRHRKCCSACITVAVRPASWSRARPRTLPPITAPCTRNRYGKKSCMTSSARKIEKYAPSSAGDAVSIPHRRRGP